MDIVLTTINAKWIHPSLALRLLKANLGSLENRCEILEFALRQPIQEKTKPILAAQPRLIGFSVSIWNHLATLELLKALEGNWIQKPIIVFGGPEVSWLKKAPWPNGAEIFRYADYVICGEGEESFRLLCEKILLNESLTEKKPKFINQGDTIVDVNKINTAYHLYTDEDVNRKLVYVESSRGCPFGCEFCLSSAKSDELDESSESAKPAGRVELAESVKSAGRSGLVGTAGFDKIKAVREFPLEPFLAEMEKLIKRGVRTFKFLDRSFNLDINRAKKIIGFFLDFILENEKTGQDSPQQNPKPFVVHFEMIPSRFPLELKELLCRFPPGTLRLEIGIQTLNPEVAELIHRQSDFCTELSNLEFLSKETNAILHVDLIAGLPGESLGSFGDGFDRLWKLLSGTKDQSAGSSGSVTSGEKNFEIQLGILKCLPGTAISRHSETFKMSYNTEPPYEVIETGALSAFELNKIKNFARFWELIVNRNPFPELIPKLLPPGQPAFNCFMELSDKLLEHFGRNWGIDQKEMKEFLTSCVS